MTTYMTSTDASEILINTPKTGPNILILLQNSARDGQIEQNLAPSTLSTKMAIFCLIQFLEKALVLVLNSYITKTRASNQQSLK